MLKTVMGSGRALAVSLVMAAAASTAHAYPSYDYYDSYDGGYLDAGYEDDWFYDYYDYDTDYNYASDVDWFDWEEDGLFE